MTSICIVSATRENQVGFSRQTKLGISLQRLAYDPSVTSFIACQNSAGLSAVFNHAIQRATDDDVLLFIHDDMYIDDYHLPRRLAEALQVYDVVGLAGNIRPDARHVGWAFWRDPGTSQLQWYDRSLLSGAVSHFNPTGERVSPFGPTPQECALLDGCFLAMSGRVIRARGIRFDERFAFHFYDVDFCRTCRKSGLRLGTWPIAVTHASDGGLGYGTPQWEAALAVYKAKWPD